MAQRPKVRLYTDQPLAQGTTVTFAKDQAHYLRTVLRLEAGAELALFNGKDGEWRATLTDLTKGKATLEPSELLRAQEAEPDIWLLFAPIKKTRIDFVAEKATELGAAKLIPVITQHTVMSRVNVDRLQANAVEAAEQCERFSVPEVTDPVKLDRLLGEWDPSRKILFCDEGSGIPPLIEALSQNDHSGPWAILVGPEGGFSDAERSLLRRQDYTMAVTLGPRILRADTAVVAGLSLLQGLKGDWTTTPDR